MSNASDFFRVQISLVGPALSNDNFGVPLIFGETTATGKKVWEYTGSNILAEVKEDHGLTSEITKAVTSAMLQNRTVKTLKVGKREADAKQKNTVTIDLAVDTAIYTISIGTNDYSYTAAGIDTVITIATGLADLITTGESDNITVVDAGDGSFTTESKDVNYSFPINALKSTTPADTTTVETTAPSNVMINFDEIEDEDSGWYGLISCHGASASQTDLDSRECADWVEASSVQKTFVKAFKQDSMLDSLDETDFGSYAKALGYNRTFVAYTGNEEKYPDAALISRVFPVNPGKTTWNNKTLVGFETDKLTSTQRSTLKGKNINYFETVGGNNILSSFAYMAAGAPVYADLVRGRDWLEVKMSDDGYGLIQRKSDLDDKISFNDNGIGAIVSEAISKNLYLAAGQDYKLIEEDSIVLNIPKAVDIPSSDKAERFLDLNNAFTCTIQGAICSVDVSGYMVTE